ncbi:MAG: zinc-binding dehydrogenase [Armatimonadetes bacterium]|nr:zinc-binding dehydrogenase [Armatimonadota bacterium]MDI9583080.1 zinc-binding dehydrogenase [Acidobacteriota bacterium]
MLAAVVEKPGELMVRQVPMPTIDDTECLVEILACSICNSTDRKILDGHFRYKGPDAYPGVIGHESVGRVVECGKAVRTFEEGDLVLRPGVSYTPEDNVPISCMYGGMAQFGKVKDPALGGSPMHQIVPPELDPFDATMLITLKETLSWLQHWDVGPGRSVVVLGSGPVGLSFAFFAKLLGCHPVVVLGRRDAPLARALKLGVDAVINAERDDPAGVVRHWTGGKGADRVIEAVGDDALAETGLSLLAPDGRLGIYGIAPTRQPGDMERRALDIGLGRSTWAIEFFGPREWEPHEHLLWLVRQNIVNLRAYYTHVVPLKDAARGFELLERKEALKVVVSMG